MYQSVIRRAMGTVELSTVLRYAALAVWLFESLLNVSFFAEHLHYNIVRAACFGLLLIAELMNGRYDERSALGAAAAGVMALCAYMGATGALLDTILIVWLLRDMDFRNLAKLSLGTMIVALAVIILAAKAGVILNYVTGDTGRIREYLGFKYALFPAQIMFSITALAVYLRKDELGLVETLVMLAANVYIFLRTDSRLSFILSILLLVLALIVRFVGDGFFKNGFVSGVMALGFVIAAAISIGATAAYDPYNPIMAALDDSALFGGRLGLGYDALQTYGVPPLGQEVDMVGNGLDNSGQARTDVSYNYIDSLYVRMLVLYGWVFTALFLIIMTAVSWQARSRGDALLLLILFLIAMHCVLDDLSIYLYYNPFLLLAGAFAAAQKNTRIFKVVRPVVSDEQAAEV